MKTAHFIYIALLASFTLASCSKNDPTPEIDLEELSAAKLIFTEVEREAHGDHDHYHDIDDAHSDTVSFAANTMLPPVGSHLHLEVGKTYRLQLIATDFAQRETQGTFVSRHENHQAFLLNAPSGSLSYTYADRDADNKAVNVGVTGYITVLAPSETFTFRYVMRHLNSGVKGTITAADWNNSSFEKFTGANDLDLKFSLHLTEGHDHH